MTSIVRAPPGTTRLTIPGDFTLTINPPVSPIPTVFPGAAFNIDSQTLLTASPYVPLANIYKYYRIKKIKITLSIPAATTTTPGYLASSLQYIQPSTNPTGITAENVINLRPNKQTKTWVSHFWTWTPHKPDDFDFRLVSDVTNYATLYASQSNLAPSIGVSYYIRFESIVEFYGLLGLT